MNRIFGLTGFPLGHSWSKKYFEHKFRSENISEVSYEVFPTEKCEDILAWVIANKDLAGFNVTIPHKTAIMPLLHEIHPAAMETGAVNTVKVIRNGDQFRLIGFNTDIFGFESSIKPLLKSHHQAAIILGTGGAARAAAWVFKKLAVDFVFVSRNPQGLNQIHYKSIGKELLQDFHIIVNASPVGMWPDVSAKPALPYHLLGPKHLLFDMVYNPEQTAFLAEAQKYGAAVRNGLEMLHLQAEKSWEIWNSGS